MAYALPLKSIDKHVEESVVVLVQEGDYPAETPGMVETLRDNYTDALMLNMASYNNRDYSLIRKAFGNYKKRSSDKSVVNWLQRRNEKTVNQYLMPDGMDIWFRLRFSLRFLIISR